MESIEIEIWFMPGDIKHLYYYQIHHSNELQNEIENERLICKSNIHSTFLPIA